MECISNLVKWCDANEGFGLIVLTLAYTGATLWLAWLSRKQLNLATELERSRIRPCIIFDIAPEHFRLVAKVSNTGLSSAKNVAIIVTPELFALFGGKNAMPPEEKELPIPFLDKKIPLIVPGRTIKTEIGGWERFKIRYPTLSFNFDVKYADSSDISYEEHGIIDLNVEVGTFHTGRKDIDDLVREIEKIRDTLDRVASGFDKPIVRVIDGKSRKE